MIADTTYIARRLWLLGEWEAALAALAPDTESELRAEIAVERWFFQMAGHDEAEQAVAALDPASPTAQVLRARLAYSRLLFRRDPRPEDRADAEAGFRNAVRDGDEATRGWAEFHWGCLLDNVDEDAGGAVPHFETALEVGVKERDALLESICVRHLSAHREPAEGVRMLRRSLHLRAALGARALTLAAQAALASALPEDDPERADLVDTYSVGAEELRIRWLLGGATGDAGDFEAFEDFED
ncbi:hypothetical protein KGQ20_17445 [Catenulispora sp. NF23]|uniref:Tetratricopeptide repeat protein n=1 Tax=Catenulispora pinistramenti TaxID=2705254 RepID=A0ABS5KML2_9ACTN|nr:hypothetical protein [Catenulispora pinistramenti]MBS2534558.1 hypothetical protein [Catenulispora pinistramenti]MBS2547268.1 hypothetical protein [Catenulispora pinistramenti]